MAEFKGTVAAILTPFDENDKIDQGYMKDHIQFIEAGGCQGIVPSGTNGEFCSMTVDERKIIIELTAKNKGKMFMVAGCGTSNLSETLELCQFAEAVGTDAMMVLPPYFFSNAPTEGTIEYYKKVFDAVSVPIFLYNIPQHTGVWITDEIIRGLEHYPHLAGVKDSSGNLDNTLRYIANFPNLNIFVGNDYQVLTVLKAGGVGLISGMPNAFPEYVAPIYQAFAAGKDASEFQARLDAARNVYINFPEFPANKYALTFRGYPQRYSRLPLLDLNEKQKADFVRMMKEAGLWNL
jgi:4-hydroxy-tetrahydrodipicolinate synthase